MSVSKKAAFLGLDVTTTEFALAVTDGHGNEDYASLPMRGSTRWRDDPSFPAFELSDTPGMLNDLLADLTQRGWDFRRSGDDDAAAATGGYLSVSCRQHDQVVLGRDGMPLLPAISWQCHAATAEVEDLKKLGVESTVGTIEPRFVLPKLRRVLRRDPSLREKIGTVCLTGDWIAMQLTGKASLSSSDALSNGLLDQATRQRADDVIRQAGFDLGWFPSVVPSGTVVGAVQPMPGDDSAATDDPWAAARRTLKGWKFVAGLGDNHASAVGCGMKDDHKRLVVSGGTSGTINLSCPASASARLPAGGDALRFEFYDGILLLLMLGDCGAWYNRFVRQFAPKYQGQLERLNQLAADVDLGKVQRVLHCDADHIETFPVQWSELILGEQVACTQFSIMLELLLRVKRMLEHVREAGTPAVEEFVLTGGLSRSSFFQEVFYVGVKRLAPHSAVRISGRTGPLRYKTSAYGALINAQLPGAGGQVSALHGDGGGRFPLADCAQPAPARRAHLDYLLRSYGI